MRSGAGGRAVPETYYMWGGGTAANHLEWYKDQLGTEARLRSELGTGDSWSSLMRKAAASPAGAQLGEWTTATREQCQRGAPDTLGRPATATAPSPTVNARSESPKNLKTEFPSSNVRLADRLDPRLCGGDKWVVAAKLRIAGLRVPSPTRHSRARPRHSWIPELEHSRVFGGRAGCRRSSFTHHTLSPDPPPGAWRRVRATRVFGGMPQREWSTMAGPGRSCHSCGTAGARLAPPGPQRGRRSPGRGGASSRGSGTGRPALPSLDNAR